MHRKTERYELLHQLRQEPDMIRAGQSVESIEPLSIEKIKKVDKGLSNLSVGQFGKRASSLPKIASRVKLS